MPVFFILLLMFSLSCKRQSVGEGKAAKPGVEQMTELNRFLVQKDKEIIENYIERKNLKMNESPTGLWYLIQNEGKGEFINDNDRIKMNYTCALLDGTKIYSSDLSGPKEIIIGKSELAQGLNEGLRMLKQGGEAVFILPPFLGYGLIGDGEKIPPRAILIYNIQILTVN